MFPNGEFAYLLRQDRRLGQHDYFDIGCPCDGQLTENRGRFETISCLEQLQPVRSVPIVKNPIRKHTLLT